MLALDSLIASVIGIYNIDKNTGLGFPGGPVLKIPHFSAGDMDWIPGWGSSGVPPATWDGQEKSTGV